MTRDADLKRIIRTRMTTHGEAYIQARAAVLATPPPPRPLPPDPFYDKTIRSFFDGERLRTIPARRRARTAVLVELATRFERGRVYAEQEVNAVLATAHEDVAWLRRELADLHYLHRRDGVYRRAEQAPARSAAQLQEVPVSEKARLGWE